MPVITIEIFKTNIRGARDAIMLADLLHEYIPGSRVSFDLEDCDRIMRIKNCRVAPDKVNSLLQLHGFSCEVLED
jgi:hypothetical protein